MIIHRGIEQGTPEWRLLRIGKPTASRFKDVLAKGKGITRAGYMMQLAAEAVTDTYEDGYTNSAMQWGTETEPMARMAYEFETNSEVEQVSFITNDIAGYSPDGLVLENGAIEIKCPKTTTHLETILSGKMPSEHMPQVQGGLWIAEREWLDFISFDPRIKSDKKMFKIRVYRDEEYIKNLENEVTIFVNELNELIKKVS